eukprot:CAMPEP_0119565660 /NCGR_PEP_ID=MMETSP1352-20130426/30788_1 /TAXON_ID=265584 /ORGANISM="Stauroneis constricta, Strain CCMP1120" /LENGTH=226 /DNA_ID=CAMNT_0007614633 /DNA_START=7 /DNA_END=683 /DNA_ORIENTATION=+
MVNINSLAICTIAATIATSDAFTPLNRPLAANRQQHLPSSPSFVTNVVQSQSTTTTLFSSNMDDDELSKLIGKRNKIVRRKKEDDADMDISSNIDALDDISLDDLPAFETKRPVRSSSSGKKKKEETKQEKGGRDQPPTIMDYMSDYEDENELHIPNRLGFTTIGWGDPTAGFSTLKKLKKQAMKQGKYNVVDLRAAYDILMEEGIVLADVSPEYGAASAAKKLSA